MLFNVFESRVTVVGSINHDSFTKYRNFFLFAYFRGHWIWRESKKKKRNPFNRPINWGYYAGTQIQPLQNPACESRQNIEVPKGRTTKNPWFIPHSTPFRETHISQSLSDRYKIKAPKSHLKYQVSIFTATSKRNRHCQGLNWELIG